MSLFVSNFNNYLTTMKIKQNYISKKSGIDENKLSRILNGKQEETGSDMDLLSKAVGQSVQFFLNEDFSSVSFSIPQTQRIAFYAGNPSKEQANFANKLLDMMENIDEVLSAKGRFLKTEF